MEIARWLTMHLNIIKFYLIKPRQQHFFFFFFLSLLCSYPLADLFPFVLIPHQVSLSLSLSLSTTNLGWWDRRWIASQGNDTVLVEDSEQSLDPAPDSSYLDELGSMRSKEKLG